VIGVEEVLSHVPCKVTGEMNEILNAPYSGKEVKEALFQMFPTKAPMGTQLISSRNIGTYVVRRSLTL
jgi:hypothetical protein